MILHLLVMWLRFNTFSFLAAIVLFAGAFFVHVIAGDDQ